MHDSYCYVCGGGLELFACQTCESAYHAECMTPSLDPEVVPNFWFCPHCVDRELHIPPSLPDMNELSPVSTRDQLNSFSGDTPGAKAVSGSEFESISHSPVTPHAIEQPSSERLDTRPLIQPTTKLQEQYAAGSTSGKNDQIISRKGKAAAVKKVTPPPRKKSKYSTFSANVDKALSVIYSELETAAQNGRSEDSLQEKIKALEQQLKVQEGEIQLARNERANERLRNERLRKEVDALKEEVEMKDAELRDWQAKLKTLMGGPTSSS